MCTVLVRFLPDSRWPVLLGAVRDEFVDRAWDPPGPHWTGPWAGLLGGRDHTAGGTWLAVDPSPDRPAAAALLNGTRRPPLADRVRPTRGTLALEALTSGGPSGPDAVVDHDGFHLLLASLERVEAWSWDGETLTHGDLTPGDHIVVNLGIDCTDDPLVPHFAPLLRSTPAPPLTRGATSRDAWGAWVDLLRGHDLDPADPRALLVRREIDGRTYGSTSASLVGLSVEGVRYDFSAAPTEVDAWTVVGPGGIEPPTEEL